jgi:toxin-antitoxin system PIN domain toxin
LGRNPRSCLRRALTLIAVDTNILVYAHRSDSPFYPTAARCIVELAQGRSAWGIPWSCIHEFLTVVTHPRIHRIPTPLVVALDQLDAWFESPTLSLLIESDAHWPELRRLLTAGNITGPLVHDARIAAICLQHGVRELWTADRDFSRFPQLNCVNPLVR